MQKTKDPSKTNKMETHVLSFHGMFCCGEAHLCRCLVAMTLGQSWGTLNKPACWIGGSSVWINHLRDWYDIVRVELLEFISI